MNRPSLTYPLVWSSSASWYPCIGSSLSSIRSRNWTHPLSGWGPWCLRLHFPVSCILNSVKHNTAQYKHYLTMLSICARRRASKYICFLCFRSVECVEAHDLFHRFLFCQSFTRALPDIKGLYAEEMLDNTKIGFEESLFQGVFISHAARASIKILTGRKKTLIRVRVQG